jgi:hypothetical protein
MTAGRRYTRADIDYVVNALEKGSTFKAACESAGISPNGLRGYMRDHPPIGKRVNRARSRARTKIETSVFQAATEPDKHGRRDMKAAELWLTNQFPADWKHRRDLAITTAPEDAEAIKRRREELSPEALEEHKEVAHREIIRQGRQERTVH